MIYWFTGQPGHGKTLHAIERLLEFKAKGRIVYACNIRKFDYERTGVLPMTPEQFCDWMNFLPDGAVALVDEAYEHGMLPKRPPGSKVPGHVDALARHRHRGLDFIFVSQSPDKQVDQFVHDLIERHVHVRRRFGTQFVHLREFDRFERSPEKATPLTIKRAKLPKHIFGTYESTELDTTERKIPWYFYALPAAVIAALAMMYWTFGNMGNLGSDAPAPVVVDGASEANGAPATVAAAAAPSTAEEYAARFIPRVPSQPWSAPIYDDALKVSNDAPRLFCMKSDPGLNAQGRASVNSSCTCVTDQGTRYYLEMQACAMVARHGQYEPFF